MSSGERFTLENLEPSHLRDLARVRENPRAHLQPVRRQMFCRLGLILPVEPPRPPNDSIRKIPCRAYRLTDEGLRLLEKETP